MREHLAQAHQRCRERFMSSLTTSSALVVCDNTNVTINEVDFYIQAALTLNYYVIVIELVCQSEEIRHVTERNQHGVGLVKALKRWSMWQELPLTMMAGKSMEVVLRLEPKIL